MKLELNKNWKFWATRSDGSKIQALDAEVPGCAHTDLMRHHLLEDPFWRDNVLLTQWVENCEFTYECKFDFWSKQSQGDDTLVLEGIDTVSRIYLNNILIGETNDMHLKYEIPVSNHLIDGENTLRIEFVTISKYIENKDINKYASLFSQGRAYIRRMQCTFGWDWVHRMVTYGIWRPVYIVSKGNGYIDHVFARTVEINPYFAAIAWNAETKNIKDGETVTVLIAAPNGELIYSANAVVKNSYTRGSVRIENPELWWPAGVGEQPLYTITVTHNENKCCSEFGIRTVTIEEIPDAIGSSYTVIVNEKRIFAKGGNWVPCDPFPSRVTKEKYDHLIGLMVEGNMNMLRVWGGGLYERPEFWQACDRQGIMVSLDFMMACSAYPEDDDDFLELLDCEMRSAIKEIRNHPSLIFYNGNNELGMNECGDDFYDGRVASALISQPAVEELVYCTDDI